MAEQMDFTLRIELNDDDRSLKDILALYSGRIRDDLDETAWNLCNSDDALQAEKFSDLDMKDYKLEHKAGEGYIIHAAFSVSAESEDFIEEVVSDWMNGFEYHIMPAVNGVYSRTGKKGLAPSLSSWEVFFQ